MRKQPKLIQRQDSPYWFIYVPQSAGRRASRLSTGETDYKQAELIFAQWILERKKPLLTPLDEIKVTDILIRYADYKSDDATVGYHMRHLKPFFANMAVSHINNQAIREYIARRKSQYARIGKGNAKHFVSPATIRRELDTFSAALGFAKREELIKEVPHIEKPAASPPREKWLSENEITKLLAACDQPYLLTYLLIAAFTAARPSSIFELKWFQVDLDNNIIHFNPDGRSQTKKYRPSVYINGALHQYLTDLRKETCSEYVISRKNGKQVKSVKKSFKAACDRAGIKKVTPYVMRHSAITKLVKDGYGLSRAGQMAGHKDPRTTLRYAKHDPNFTREGSEILSTGVVLAQKVAKNGKNEQKSEKIKAVNQ